MVLARREGRNIYLDAVVAVSKVVHGFELLVDDADTGFMCADCDVFNILGRFSLFFQLSVNTFRSLDGGLRVKLGWIYYQ